MIKKWLNWINIGIAGLAGIGLLLAALIFLTRSRSIEIQPPVKDVRRLLKNAYEQTQANSSQLNPGLFHLKTSAPSPQLPNLRALLTYYGRNSRPDAETETPLMHFSLSTNNRESASVLPQQRLYLSYERNSHPPRYVFSPNNAQTPLWIEAQPLQNQAMIQVFLQGEHNNIIRKPSINAQFTLPEKEFARYGGGTWEIGKWRVDGTLLARQKARWYGPDLFLQQHGGQEYAFTQGKQRVDFGEGNEVYSIFIDENSCLIWKDGRWVEVAPGQNSLGYPLMCVKKMDSRLMNLELWDVNGRGKIVLNLLKSLDSPLQRNLQQALKFVGARTLTQFLFEINQKRILLRPKDWLLYKNNRWELLQDPVAIKQFVERKITGPLFTLEGIVRKEERQVLVGNLYSANRTEVLEIEIPLVPSGTAKKPRRDDDKIRPPPFQANSGLSNQRPEQKEGLQPSLPPSFEDRIRDRLKDTQEYEEDDSDDDDEDDEDS